MKHLIVVLAVALIGLSGCGGREHILSADENPFFTGDDHRRHQLLKRENFSLDIVRFDDKRRPRSMAKETAEDVIYEFKPDELMHGVKHRLPVLFSKQFNYGKRKNRVFLVEMDLRKVKTLIRTGTLTTGSFGRYMMELEIDVTVRAPNSNVVVNDTFYQEITLRRSSYGGRPPSTEMDRSRMYQIVEEGVRRMAEDIAWDTKKFQNKPKKTNFFTH